MPHLQANETLQHAWHSWLSSHHPCCVCFESKIQQDDLINFNFENVGCTKKNRLDKKKINKTIELNWKEQHNSFWLNCLFANEEFIDFSTETKTS